MNTTITLSPRAVDVRRAQPAVLAVQNQRRAAQSAAALNSWMASFFEATSAALRGIALYAFAFGLMYWTGAFIWAVL